MILTNVLYFFSVIVGINALLTLIVKYHIISVVNKGVPIFGAPFYTLKSLKYIELRYIFRLIEMRGKFYE